LFVSQNLFFSDSFPKGFEELQKARSLFHSSGDKRGEAEAVLEQALLSRKEKNNYAMVSVSCATV
jgi:hypothetical protein